jgi:cystathionine gamma-synthase
LDVAKGPSLGTNFTLVCPYTLLAHYHELDFAISYNVPPNLIRFAVGLEDFEELKAKFEAALSKSRLHPKITIPASS